MSIIYDALKKVEEKVDMQIPVTAEVKVPLKAKPDFKKMLIYFLVLASGLVAANLIFNALSQHPATRDLAKVKSLSIVPEKLTPALADKTQAVNIPVQTRPVAAVVQAQTESQGLVINEPVAPELTLNGVFFSDDGGYALINNKIVKEGGFIQGVKLVKIYQDSVEMEYNGAIFKLSSLAR